jgi:alkanesulfonate monooxygenase SsuD/methylene tetrahydromethanopterin reductase-like flavin-dependent oxidoreductase (luciferase family)
MMKLGAVFPQAEIGNDPVVVKDFVQAVQDLGYDYLSVPERADDMVPIGVDSPAPLWVGGMADADLWRAARWGGGWFAPTLPIPQASERVSKLRACLEKAGRKNIRIRCRVGMSMSFVWPEYVQLWGKLGATHVELDTAGAGLQTLQEHVEALRRFKSKVEGGMNDGN